jgi:2-(1,2-epoxy-1,2-dihydrophenyl)acetyl-CoA isomerase
VRCILITGAGRGFCAGGDFKGERTNGPAEVRVRLDLAYRWIRMLMLGEKPVVTAVNGPAAGAGFALALMGDVIVASDQAFFKAGFPAMGTVPDYGLAWTLPRTIGVLQAKEVLLCNRRIPAAEAQRLGFVSRVVPHDDLFNEAMRVARQLASGPYATGPAKRMITLAPSLSLEAFLEQEAMAQTIAFASQDYAEGALAFREHREPRFVGA